MKLPKSSVDRVVGDLRGAELGDPRRVRRLLRVAASLARSPKASLPALLGGDAEVQAAYRLVNNGHVMFEELVKAHAEATRQRAEEVRRVLVLHDTTDGSFPDTDPREIGYLQTGKAGFKIHLSLAVEADGWRRPLGVVHAETLHRPKRSRRKSNRKVSGVETARWEDREFTRWWRGMQAAADRLAGCERVVHVADREGDSYDLMAQLLGAKQRFVIRVRVDRRGREVGSDADAWSTVKQVAAGCSGMLEREVGLSRRKAKGAPEMNRVHPPRKKRIAKLQFAATPIEIPRPRYLRDPVPAKLTLNLVHVIETDPPPGQHAVEWLLYTTEPIDTAAQVEAVVDTYRARWLIEEFNSALKTGCAYEERQFETRHALLTMLALSLPVACEVLALRARARSVPNTPATDVLTPQQFRVLRVMGSHKLPATATAQEALLAVAAMGGHLKRNGPPGWKLLQRGMTLLLAYEAGWAAARAAR